MIFAAYRASLPLWSQSQSLVVKVFYVMRHSRWSLSEQVQGDFRAQLPMMPVHILPSGHGIRGAGVQCISVMDFESCLVGYCLLEWELYTHTRT